MNESSIKPKIRLCVAGWAGLLLLCRAAGGCVSAEVPPQPAGDEPGGFAGRGGDDAANLGGATSGRSGEDARGGSAAGAAAGGQTMAVAGEGVGTGPAGTAGTYGGGVTAAGAPAESGTGGLVVGSAGGSASGAGAGVGGGAGAVSGTSSGGTESAAGGAAGGFGGAGGASGSLGSGGDLASSGGIGGASGSSGSGGDLASGGGIGGASGSSGSGGDLASGGGIGGASGSSGSGGMVPSTGGGPGNYSGRWIGMTSQQRLFRMDAYMDGVLGTTFDWQVYAPSTGCTAIGETSTTFGTPAVVNASGEFTKGPNAGTPISHTLSGIFDSSDASSGTLNLTHSAPNCNASALLTWTAQRVVCGDARMHWPETCDDGNTSPNDGCSALCQLTPIAETEPNDTPETSGDPVSDDAIFTGAIVPGTSWDVFPVQNPYPGAIAVQLETHGETMGICDGHDTYLEVRDTSGTLLAEDDDSGRAFFCSQLTVFIPSGQTVYVVLSSARGAEIPVYNLHVKYPHA